MVSVKEERSRKSVPDLTSLGRFSNREMREQKGNAPHTVVCFGAGGISLARVPIPTGRALANLYVSVFVAKVQLFSTCIVNLME